MNDTKDFLTIIAAFSASVFFIWQIVAGWLVINLEVSILTERKTKNADEDWLAFKLLLKKGKTDTLQIKHIEARIRTQDGSIVPKGSFVFDEIRRLGADDKDIKWDKLDKDGKNISLSPEESFHLGRYAIVNSGQPLIVEMVLHGTRRFWRRGFQWRSSIVSLPIDKNKSESKAASV
jgi:hypothetical protein